jgi:hypothetical protein
VLEPDGEVHRRNLRSKQLGAAYPDQPGTSRPLKNSPPDRQLRI